MSLASASEMSSSVPPLSRQQGNTSKMVHVLLCIHVTGIRQHRSVKCGDEDEKH